MRAALRYAAISGTEILSNIFSGEVDSGVKSLEVTKRIGSAGHAGNRISTTNFRTSKTQFVIERRPGLSASQKILSVSPIEAAGNLIQSEEDNPSDLRSSSADGIIEVPYSESSSKACIAFPIDTVFHERGTFQHWYYLVATFRGRPRFLLSFEVIAILSHSHPQTMHLLGHSTQNLPL